MNEKEFLKKYPKGKIEVGIYYYIDDDDGAVVMDWESMRDEFEFELGGMEEFMDKDELQQIVSEKLKQIEKKKEIYVKGKSWGEQVKKSGII